MFRLFILIAILYPTVSIADPSIVNFDCASVSVNPVLGEAPLTSDQILPIQVSIQWSSNSCDLELYAELRYNNSKSSTTVILNGTETELTIELPVSKPFWGGTPTLTVLGFTINTGFKTLYSDHVEVINICESKAVAHNLLFTPFNPTIPGKITGLELYTIEEIESAHRRSLDPALLNEATSYLRQVYASYTEEMHGEMYRYNNIDVYNGYSLSCLHQCYGGACELNTPRLEMSFKPIADLDQRFQTLPLRPNQLVELASLKVKATLESERLKTYHLIMNNYEGHNPLNHEDPYELSHIWWVLKSIQAFHIYIISNLEQLQGDEQSQLRRLILKQSSQIFASEVHRMLNSDLCDADVLEALDRPLNIIMNRDLDLINIESLLREYNVGYQHYVSCLNRAIQL